MFFIQLVKRKSENTVTRRCTLLKTLFVILVRDNYKESMAFCLICSLSDLYNPALIFIPIISLFIFPGDITDIVSFVRN